MKIIQTTFAATILFVASNLHSADQTINWGNEFGSTLYQSDGVTAIDGSFTFALGGFDSADYDVIFGAVSGTAGTNRGGGKSTSPGGAFNIQTATIPEPGAAILLMVFGIIVLLRRPVRVSGY